MKVVKTLIILFLSFQAFSQSTVEFRFGTPSFDCANSVVTYDIEARLDAPNSNFIETTMKFAIFNNDFAGNVTIINQAGNQISNFINAPFTASAADMVLSVNSSGNLISYTSRYLVTGTEWETIGQIQLIATSDLTGYFCPIIIFDENSFDNTGLLTISGIESIFLISNQSLTDEVNQLNWIQFFSDGSGAPDPTPVCIFDPCPLDSNVQIWSESGDIYVDDPSYGLLLRSENGDCWRMTIDNNGETKISMVPCP